MKHGYMIAGLIAFLLLAGNAAAGELSYGVKAGMMLSNITQTPAEWEPDKSYKAGLTGGLYLNYTVTGNFSLQPELLYTSKGVKSNLYEGLILVDLTASFDYLEIPLLAKYSFPIGGKFRPCIYAGPGFAYTLSSELEVSAWLFSGNVDFSSLTHVTDFFVVAGAGFDYELGKGVLVFDVRFQRGFTNVILSGDFEIDGSTQTIDEDDFKNYGFAFMVGYGI